MGVPVGTAKSRLHRALAIRCAPRSKPTPDSARSWRKGGSHDAPTTASTGPSPCGSSSVPEPARPTTSTTSSAGPPGHGSDPAGPPSKGGLPWTSARAGRCCRPGSRSAPLPCSRSSGCCSPIVAAIVAVGSRPRLPEPFGPARNGALVYVARRRHLPARNRRRRAVAHRRRTNRRPRPDVLARWHEDAVPALSRAWPRAGPRGPRRRQQSAHR